MDDYKFLFKVVLIGEAGVGKTCLVKRYCQGVFPVAQSATIGVDFMIKTVDVNGEQIKLQIWDTAGQERFRTITQSYYRSANAIVIVYDIANQPSFDRLVDWMRELKQHINDKVILFLVGNKCDLNADEREIPMYIGAQFAQRFNMKFIETSAKESKNVEKIFQDLAELLTTQARELSGYSSAASKNQSVSLEATTKATSTLCCK
jgi:Ras-related protein Rab-30